MLVMLVLVSVALVITLAYLMFGPRSAQPVSQPRASTAQALPADSSALNTVQAELDRVKKERDDQRSQLQELKGELKQTKKKLYEQKEAGKGDQDLARARADVERNASIQLEQARSELATALGELQKLRESTGKQGRREQPHAPVPVAAPAPVAAPVPTAAPVPVAAPVERPERKPRELNDAERERLERAEHTANKERARAAELDRELKRLKGRGETNTRVYTVAKGELELLRDKFKALEKRLNRTLLEKDLLTRAVRDMAAKSGEAAGRTELTAEEIATSDRKVEDRLAAEATVHREQQAKAEAAAQAQAATEATPAPAAPSETEPKPA